MMPTCLNLDFKRAKTHYILKTSDWMNTFYVNTVNTLTKLDWAESCWTNIHWVACHMLSTRLGFFTCITAFPLYKWTLISQSYILIIRKLILRGATWPARGHRCHLCMCVCVSLHVSVDSVGRQDLIWRSPSHANKGLSLKSSAPPPGTPYGQVSGHHSLVGASHRGFVK